jgi:hypothetical protein
VQHQNILTSSLQASKTKSLCSWEWVVFGKKRAQLSGWVDFQCRRPLAQASVSASSSQGIQASKVEPPTHSLPPSLTHSLTQSKYFI